MKPRTARILGGLMVALGAVAFLFPLISSVATGVFVGALMFSGGLLRLFNLNGPRGSGLWWFELVGGLLSVVAAVLILFFPLTGVLTLTLVLAAYFCAQGIMRLVAAWSEKSGRGWLIVGGLLDLFLSILVVTGWPQTGLWVLGVLLGVHLTMMGFLMLLRPRDVLDAEAQARAPVAAGTSTSKEPTRATNEQRVDVALEETFPASDPPGYGPR